jgi:hypothetical protein
MPVEFGLWRIDGATQRLTPEPMPTESELEDLIERDSSVLGQQLLIVGRQVHTSFGKIVDLMAVDSDGTVVVIELKRDRTPRDIVAQILDYASWAEELKDAGVRQIWETFAPDREFDEAFGETFGIAVPDTLGSELNLVIVAGSVDPGTERIVAYLNRKFDVPINVVFFQYFTVDDHRYVARTWLVDDAAEGNIPQLRKQTSATTPWNGRDWYVSFGDDGDPRGRSWEDARTLGFISAGGGKWYSQTLKNLPVGARIFVHVPATGYVGVGRVSGPASPTSSAELLVDGAAKKFRELPLTRQYHSDLSGDDEEWVVPVDWEDTRDLADSFWKPGMFANQNSACKLRNQFTIDEVTAAFGVES